MALEGALSAPVTLMDPLSFETPGPAEGCDVCAALFRQWKAASAPGSPSYDTTRATDCAIGIRRHPHDRKKRGRA